MALEANALALVTPVCKDRGAARFAAAARILTPSWRLNSDVAREVPGTSLAITPGLFVPGHRVMLKDKRGQAGPLKGAEIHEAE